MTKLCPRGKAAAKRKFKVYPSAYANAYASKICAGKIKDPSGLKRKDFKGPKPVSAKEGRYLKKPRELTESEKKRNKSQEAISRSFRKNRQKNPSATLFKGKDIELTFTDINPFTDSVEQKRPYGVAPGKSYPVRGTDAERASVTRFRSFADYAREVDKPKRIAKKSLGGMLDGHSVAGSSVQGDYGVNPSAIGYYKDLLK